jgi:TonB family protein
VNRPFLASIGFHLLILLIFLLGERVGKWIHPDHSRAHIPIDYIEMVSYSNILSNGSPKNLVKKRKKLQPKRNETSSVLAKNSVLTSLLPSETELNQKNLKSNELSSNEIDPSIPSAQGKGGSPLQFYVSNVVHKINEIKIYPENSIFRSEEGRVVVLIRVFADGTIGHFHLSEACPFEDLNLATLDTISQLRRLPPLPGNRTKPLTILVPVSYELKTKRS